MGFRAWLRGLLEEGMYRSQYEMAEAFGKKQPTINHWLHGIRQPDLGVLRSHFGSGEQAADPKS